MSIVRVSRLIPLSTGYRDCCLLREACLPVRIRRRRWVKTSERRRNSFDGFQSGCGRRRDVIVHCGLPFDWPSTFLLVPPFPSPLQLSLRLPLGKISTPNPTLKIFSREREKKEKERVRIICSENSELNDLKRGENWNRILRSREKSEEEEKKFRENLERRGVARLSWNSSNFLQVPPIMSRLTPFAKNHWNEAGFSVGRENACLHVSRKKLTAS